MTTDTGKVTQSMVLAAMTAFNKHMDNSPGNQMLYTLRAAFDAKQQRDHECCGSQAEAITKLTQDNAKLLDALEKCMGERDEARRWLEKWADDDTDVLYEDTVEFIRSYGVRFHQYDLHYAGDNND